MAKVPAAKRVRNMIKGLKELETEYSILPSSEGLLFDIRKAIQSLERVWKSLVG